MKRRNNKKGFTLAELLIVVAIIAVLVAIAIPVFGSQLENAKQAVDEANCRSAYGMAMADYLSQGQKSTTGSVLVATTNYSWEYDGSKMTVSTTTAGSSTKYASGISYDGSNFT